MAVEACWGSEGTSCRRKSLPWRDGASERHERRLLRKESSVRSLRVE